MTTPELPELLTAAELDAMSPDERAQALRDRIVTGADELPAEFHQRISETARHLGAPASPPR